MRRQAGVLHFVDIGDVAQFGLPHQVVDGLQHFIEPAVGRRRRRGGTGWRRGGSCRRGRRLLTISRCEKTQESDEPSHVCLTILALLPRKRTKLDSDVNPKETFTAVKTVLVIDWH